MRRTLAAGLAAAALAMSSAYADPPEQAPARGQLFTQRIYEVECTPNAATCEVTLTQNLYAAYGDGWAAQRTMRQVDDVREVPHGQLQAEPFGPVLAPDMDGIHYFTFRDGRWVLELY